MKTAEDFKKQAKAKNIQRWDVHDCSICGYWCGFVIRGDEVYYDSGCDCVTYTDIHPSSWEEMANSYNLNAGAADVEERSKKSPEFAKSVKEDREFWGFEGSN